MTEIDTGDQAMERELCDFIVRELRGGDRPPDLDHTTYLIEEEIIDSLGIMSMIPFIERRWGVSIEPEDVLLENFETVPTIAELVRSKLSGDGGQ